MPTPLTCPECHVEGQVYYERVERDDLAGRMVKQSYSGDGPFLDEQADDFTRYTLSYEQVECRACDACWPSFDEFMTCFLAPNHDEECVL